MRRLTLLGALVGAALLLPAGAQAATLTNAGGTLTYTADAGSTNAVGFDQLAAPADTVDVYRMLLAGDDDPITPTGCAVEATNPEFIQYRCPGVTGDVVADAGDGDDILDGGGAAAFEIPGAPLTVLEDIPAVFDLGDGDDLTAGGGAGDDISTGDGDDLMALDPPGGGPGGSDEASAGAGDDDVLSGRGNDTVDAGEGSDHVGGGPGNDTLDGGGGDDDLAAGPGAADILRGGGGNDTLRGECEDQPCPPSEPIGADDVDGGAGFDLFQYDNYGPDRVTITLDGAANDGLLGEGDNIRPSVEDVKVTGPGPATLTAGAGINTLTSGDGDDTINSRDGWPDRVACGAGADVANADTLDIVETDCETVNRAAAGNVFEDAAPTVAWTAPASGARLSTTAPTALSATAADDKGIAEVRFLDDERTVCSDTVAPYTCDYTPQGDDVGRNTLIVIAIDSAGQTASAVRAVRVPRFTATLSARTTPRRDRRAPYRFTTTGRLRLPAGVTAAQGCRGTVAVQIKAGTKTVSTRRVKLRANCTYRSRVTFRLPERLRPRRLRRIVRFGGNSVVNATNARRQTLRVG